MTDRPIVVAITCASGAPYAVRLLEALTEARRPVQLIVSSHGFRLLDIGEEVGEALAERLHPVDNCGGRVLQLKTGGPFSKERRRSDLRGCAHVCATWGEEKSKSELGPTTSPSRRT